MLGRPYSADRRRGANFMNSWNSEQVHALYPSQALGTLTKREDGRVNVERPDVAAILRQKAASGEGDPNEESTRQEAIKEANGKTATGPQLPYTKPIFGLAAGWVSEVAPPGMLDGILTHATKYLNPSWSNGGLYYPRNDAPPADEEGNWRIVDPVTGNAAIGYARLNVADGQKIMWENAWTPEQVKGSVAVENVSFSDGVDFLRCQWASESEDGFTGLVLTMRTWTGQKSSIHPSITALPNGQFDVFVNGSLTRTHTQSAAQNLQLEVEVSGEETEVCILKK